LNYEYLAMVLFPLVVLLKYLDRRAYLKKIIITIKESADDKEKCTVNLKMEESKTATEPEKVMASNVYHAINEKLEELSKIK